MREKENVRDTTCCQDECIEYRCLSKERERVIIKVVICTRLFEPCCSAVLSARFTTVQLYYTVVLLITETSSDLRRCIEHCCFKLLYYSTIVLCL